MTKDKIDRFLDWISFVLSAVFSPYLVSFLFISIVVFVQSSNLKQFLPWILISLFFIGLIPAVYTFWLLETKRISDLHISNHEERKIPFFVGALSALVGSVILLFMHAPNAILAVVFAYAINAIFVSAITWYWKISIHSAFFTASILILMLFFGVKFWPLFILWIPLAWSRIHRKKHTPDQVLFGAVMAVLVTIIVFYFFGYRIGG